MLHNRSMEDTLGPRWPSHHPHSTDSLFYPDICLSTNKRANQESHRLNAVKKSPMRGGTPSRRETPQKSIHESPVIEERGSYYINKRYGSVAGHEKSRRSSLSFLVDKSDTTAKKKEKKDRSMESKGDYKLQVKIEGLKNLIKTEKEMMLGLKKKISSEKSELTLLQHKLEVNKIKAKRKSKKSLELNKSSLALMESTNRQLDRMEESVLSKRPPAVSDSILKKRSSVASTVVYESVNRSMSVLRESPSKYGRMSMDNRRGSSGLYEEKMSVLEDSIKQLKVRYEEEISGLRSKLGEWRNENLRLKESTAYDKGCERIQVLQARRLQDLVDTLGKKERELVVQERYYKEQIDGMGMKVIELNDEMEKALRNQERVKELEGQMENKNNDIEIMKKYFVEKLKSTVEDHYNQKKEWSEMHKELVKEVNSLKIKENMVAYMREPYVKENKYKGKGSRI